MKQYKITSRNISIDSEDDCVLSPDDPINELKIASYLGGLGAQERLAQYKLEQVNSKITKGPNHGEITSGFKSRIRKHI